MNELVVLKLVSRVETSPVRSLIDKATGLGVNTNKMTIINNSNH